MITRRLGSSGIEVSGLGLGCWAIGGPFDYEGRPAGWGGIRDKDSIDALHRALDLGVTFFDTANIYGCGHSEETLGKALAGRRSGVVISTKFGNVCEPETRTAYAPERLTPDDVRSQLEASLRRLGTDYIDLYLFHLWDFPLDRAADIRDALEDYVAEGKIRGYGWSTDRLENVKLFAAGEHCTAVQQQLNVIGGSSSGDSDAILALCEEKDLASVNRAPLAMGILTGKFTPASTFPADDVRSRVEWFPGFREGRPDPDWLDRIEAVRGILTDGGRTLAQGAIAWLWGRSGRTVPIPGFKTTAQVEENARALEYGPLSVEAMAEVDRLLGR